MIGFLKESAPWLLYSLGIAAFLLSVTGKPRAGILFLIPLLPLQNVLQKLHPLPLGKDLNDILLIGMVIGVLIYKRSQKEKPPKDPLNGLLIFTVLYTLFGLWRGSMSLGLPLPVNPADPRVQLWKNYTIFPVLFFIVRGSIGGEKSMRVLFILMLCSMLLMDYYTANQIRWMSGINSRIFIRGTFVSIGPNEISAFYSAYTMILIGIMSFMRRSHLKLFTGFIIGMNFFCVLFLYSRAAYMAVTFALLGYASIRKKQLILPLLLLIILWQIVLPTNVVKRIQETETAENTLDPSSQKRLVVWGEAMELFRKSPLIGTGFATIAYAGLSFGFIDTHNVYVKILAEQGIVGLILFLMLLWHSMRSGWSLYKEADSRFLKGLGLGFTLCVVATIVNNFFGDRWTHLQLGAYYWVFLGLVVRGLEIARSRQTSEVPEPARQEQGLFPDDFAHLRETSGNIVAVETA